MGKNSKISWTDHTFNPWWGCVKVSDGCKHCYAEIGAKRFSGEPGDLWGPGSNRRFFGDVHWDKPKHWNRQAQKEGVRHKVFCASYADVFENREDLDNPRVRLFELIEDTPHLDWLLLTKRPENVNSFINISNSFRGGIPNNVWLGTTVENQEMANKRIPILLGIPASVLWLSVEPMLGPIDLKGGHEEVWPLAESRIAWVIVGGESGRNPRPMAPNWARQVRDDCKAAGVPFFFKQFGGADRDKGGDLLDGTEHKEFPNV